MRWYDVLLKLDISISTFSLPVLTVTICAGLSVYWARSSSIQRGRLFPLSEGREGKVCRADPIHNCVSPVLHSSESHKSCPEDIATFSRAGTRHALGLGGYIV